MKPIFDFATSLVEPITELIGKVIPDKDKAANLAYKVSTMAATHAHAEVLSQLEVNKVEAAHKSLFVAGWRPFIGWTCGLAMFNNYVLASWFSGITPMPLEVMMPVLLGMLGLGGMRSFEKAKKVSREK